MSEPKRVTSAEYNGHTVGFALTDYETLALSFSWLPLETSMEPPIPALERVASGLLDGVYILGTELGTHRSVSSQSFDLDIPCGLINTGRCFYDSGSALWAKELARLWLDQGADDELIWRYLERRYQEASQ